MKKVNTIIASDIHLGFSLSRAKDLLAVLKDYEFDRLMLNGDIFEDLNFERLTKEHWQLLSFFRKVAEKKEIIWIVGNHDGQAEILSHLIGVEVYREYIWEIEGTRFLAIHGHQFDRFLTHNYIISTLAGHIYYWITRIEPKGHFLSRWVKRNTRGWLRQSDEVAKKSLNYGRQKKVDYVFCGHTHMAREEKKKSIKYLNSGSWVETPGHLIVIKDNTPKLEKFV